MRNYKAIEDFILGKLKRELPSDLYYHSVHHTQHVVKAAEFIASQEKIEKEEDLFLLKVSALYHDSGFLHKYEKHEEESFKIASADLTHWGLTVEQIEIICGMIKATEIPQQPHTPLESILADADLFYLGGDDYDRISSSLFEEIKVYLNITDPDKWKKIQIDFLSNHHFHTDYCRKNLEPGKQKHLERIKSQL